MEIAALYVYAYLVGAVPTAYVIARLVKGIDIREYGSGNIGGSNLFYNVGKAWVVPLGLFEVFIKGASPVWAGLFLLDLDRASPALMGAPLLAVAGHNWSVLLRFMGGRGLVVAAGALLVLAYRELIVFVVVAVGGWAVFRSSGIWVIIGLLLLPPVSVAFEEPMAVTWFCVGLLALVVAKRLTSNWTPLPAGLPRRQVFWNRLLRDRDVHRREEWLDRGPRSSKDSAT